MEKNPLNSIKQSKPFKTTFKKKKKGLSINSN